MSTGPIKRALVAALLASLVIVNGAGADDTEFNDAAFDDFE